MKFLAFRFLFAFVVTFFSLFVAEKSYGVTYNLSGDWYWQDIAGSNVYYGVAHIAQEGDSLTFKWDWEDQYQDVWEGNGSTNEDKITIDGHTPGGSFTAQFTGKVEDGGTKLTGTWNQYYFGSPAGSGTFIATRISGTPLPISSPLPSSSPSPAPPTPFLDLPWDYEGKGLSFTEAALSMSSYFDHEYPLLSTSLTEPQVVQNNLTNFEGKFQTKLEYSRHDGYDYAKRASALLNEPVLAAADGVATLGNKNSCGACGNYILIDHGNGYQTRYYHMSEEDLIVGSGQSVNVSKGQQIGKIGATGNVIPPGDAGAHIHFMVVEDKNRDGNFEDNIPDGLVDPFGWQSEQPDPWPNYSFNYSGKNRTGNKSYYLWTKAIANLSPTLTSNGGFFELEKFKLNFPQDATNQNLNLDLKAAPNAKPSNVLQSIGSTLFAKGKDALGNIVETFQKDFTFIVKFKEEELTGFDLSTLSVYSSKDGINWTKVETQINWAEKTASANINHFSYFALMAERLDTTAPTTTAIIDGVQGQAGWYRTNVEVILSAQDDEDGLGVDYTMYKINDQEWQQYLNQLNFENEGHYKIDYYSVDKDENVEQIKSTEFDLDKTVPEAKIYVDQTQQDLILAGIDENSTSVFKTSNDKSKAIYEISDKAGNTLVLDVRDFDNKRRDKFQIFSLAYNQNQQANLPSNYYRVVYGEKPSQLNVKHQTFEINGQVKIKITFDKKKNESTVFKLDNNHLKQKETKEGLILLQLTTNNGNLEYTY